jgi:hypothetical protein
LTQPAQARLDCTLPAGIDNLVRGVKQVKSQSGTYSYLYAASLVFVTALIIAWMVFGRGISLFWTLEAFSWNDVDAVLFMAATFFAVSLFFRATRIVEPLPGTLTVAFVIGALQLAFDVASVAAVEIVWVGFLALLVWYRMEFGRASSIFISYQRSTSWLTARSLHDQLTALKADVFLDVHDLNEGRFAYVIEKEIAQRDHFVVILTPTTLYSEWVCREVDLAMQYEKNIIPVLVDEFRFDKLPPDLPEASQAIAARLSEFNAVRLNLEYFDAAFAKLTGFLRLRHW